MLEAVNFIKCIKTICFTHFCRVKTLNVAVVLLELAKFN